MEVDCFLSKLVSASDGEERTRKIREIFGRYSVKLVSASDGNFFVGAFTNLRPLFGEIGFSE